MTQAPGTLYVVATPIGNLGDISARALQTLAAVDCIAAEDTRHSGRLLSHYGIRTPLLSCHAHNERARTARLAAMLRGGRSVALISDAGVPLISDPGYLLVCAVHEAGLPIVPVPGANAALAALSVSGLPTDRFAFEGFPPARPAARLRWLESLRNESRTLLFYESPRRIVALLEAMAAQFGAGRRAVAARELTKIHETLYRDTLDGLARRLTDEERAGRLRGEFVLLVEGAETTVDADAAEAEAERIFALLRAELPPGQAARLTAQIAGVAKNRLYALCAAD